MDTPGQRLPGGLAAWLAGYAGMRAPRRSAPWRACAVVAIVGGLTMVLWSLPVPAAIGRPGLYAALAGVALVSRYLRLSRVLALLALGLSLPLGGFVGALHAWIGSDTLLPLGAGLLATGLVGAGALARLYGQQMLAAIIEDAWLGPAWLIERAAARLRVRL